MFVILVIQKYRFRDRKKDSCFVHIRVSRQIAKLLIGLTADSVDRFILGLSTCDSINWQRSALFSSPHGLWQVDAFLWISGQIAQKSGPKHEVIWSDMVYIWSHSTKSFPLSAIWFVDNYPYIPEKTVSRVDFKLFVDTFIGWLLGLRNIWTRPA